MFLEQLFVSNLRIIKKAELRPNKTLNIIVGENASGKTSILESIDILSRGRSFRTNKTSDLIKYKEKCFMISAKVNIGQGTGIKLGIERHLHDTKLHYQGKQVRKQSKLASSLPVLSLHPHGVNILTGPPNLRRSFLDWGVFHVEQDYSLLWKRYNRSLKQRNSALKSKLPKPYCLAWDHNLVESAETIHFLRSQYLRLLKPLLAEYCPRFLGKSPLSLNYLKGWPETTPFASLLNTHYLTHLSKGFTNIGPHMADIEISLNGLPVKGTISRGQQKILETLLKLAQIKLMREKYKKSVIFLLDDLNSELDDGNRELLLRNLLDFKSQVFISSLNPDIKNGLHASDFTLFHVKQGEIV